jgi:thioredoxin-related protein
MNRLLPGLLLLALLSPALCAAPEYPGMGPDIFDRQARGGELVAQAVTRAQQEGKRVVLLFGANWCPWCRRLHHAFTDDSGVVAILRRSFVLVHVDANTRNDKKRNADIIARYGDPLQKYGLPAIVVLEADGRQLTTQETASWAAPADEEVARRVTAFLASWAPGVKQSPR